MGMLFCYQLNTTKLPMVDFIKFLQSSIGNRFSSQHDSSVVKYHCVEFIRLSPGTGFEPGAAGL